MPLLTSRGHTVEYPWSKGNRLARLDLRGFDLAHVWRAADPQTVQVVRAAKEQGAAVVWDNDDDAGLLPRGSTAHKRFGGMKWERQVQGMRRIFAVADLATATNEHLAERLRGYGARRTTVIENFIPRGFLHPPRKPQREVTIGWVAGWEHYLDVERVPIVAALQRLLDERPEVRVRSVGIGLGLKDERYATVKDVPWLRLADVNSYFDIGIAPLADIGSNRVRSNVKLKEYAAGGAAWLASPVGPYLGLGEKQGGRLVPDDRWYEELVRLVDKPRERHKLAKRAVEWAAGQTMEGNVELWEAAFLDAVERSRAAAG